MRLTNSLGHKQEPFIPRQSGKVKIFTCGPSVYQWPHLGNYRTFLYEDILVRYLEYQGFKVDRLINLTDIEDKMYAEAQRLGQTPQSITAAVKKSFLEEIAALGIKTPTTIAPASECLDESTRIIKRLLEQGQAYRHQNNVFFDPLKVPDFGKLYGLDMRRWPQKKVRFKRDTYNGLRWNLGDFILWHGFDGSPIQWWDSDIGRGRPSWNIQDPAIIVKHLGDQVDINCGGIDNIIRHHDYNIAVMESYTGKNFSRYYLHGQHLLFEGKTMSKSRGNIVYPTDVASAGYSSRELRFFLLSKHYRRRLNYTEANLSRQATKLRRAKHCLRTLLRQSEKKTAEPDKSIYSAIKALIPAFEEKLDDDLDLASAFKDLTVCFERLVRLAPNGLTSDAGQRLRQSIAKIDQVAGVFTPF